MNYPFNITLYKTVEWEFFIHHQLIRSRPSLRSKLRSRGNGGDGTSKGFWVLTPNTSTHPWAAMATTSARRSPCWLAAVPRLAVHLHVKTRRPSQSNLASTMMWYYGIDCIILFWRNELLNPTFAENSAICCHRSRQCSSCMKNTISDRHRSSSSIHKTCK